MLDFLKEILSNDWQAGGHYRGGGGSRGGGRGGGRGEIPDSLIEFQRKKFLKEIKGIRISSF